MNVKNELASIIVCLYLLKIICTKQTFIKGSVDGQ